MTEVYAPDIIISEASTLISTALSNIDLPAQSGYTPGGSQPTGEMVIFSQPFDPAGSKVDAPALYMQVIHGASGRLSGIGVDDICTLRITVNLYIHSVSTDSIWLARVCHLILRALGDWKRVRDAMTAFDQKEKLIEWVQDNLISSTQMVGVIDCICRMPSPAEVAAENTPLPT